MVLSLPFSQTTALGFTVQSSQFLGLLMDLEFKGLGFACSPGLGLVSLGSMGFGFRWIWDWRVWGSPSLGLGFVRVLGQNLYWGLA